MYTFPPRDYQLEALNKCRDLYDRGTNRLMGVCFTGGGKTTGIACNLPDRFPDLCFSQPNRPRNEYGLLFLSHRREILFQAYEKFRRVYAGRASCGLEMGERHASGLEDFIFASIDSIGRLMSERIFKYNRRKFGVIIPDEGHHVTEQGIWDNVLTYFGVGSDPESHFTLSDGKKPLCLFLTATPNRNDGRPMDKLVDAVAFEYDIVYGIANGWLVEPRFWSAFNVGKGDPDAAEVIIKGWLDHCSPDTRTLFFASSVQESIEVVNMLNEEGICSAAHVDATTPKEERDITVPGFADGTYTFMGNMLVFTEGYDNPSIACIIDNGDNGSKVRFVQKVGRALRPAPDAMVDSWPTKELRRAAIAASSKPYATYLVSTRPRHKLSIVANLMGRPDLNITPDDGASLVEEVIDVIEALTEEQPERPIANINSIRELKVMLSEFSIWDSTIYNDKAKHLSPLRWIFLKGMAALYLPWNPRIHGKYGKACVAADPSLTWDDTAIILYIDARTSTIKTGEVRVGGWNETRGRPVGASIRPYGQTFLSKREAFNTIEAHLKDADPDLWTAMMRGGMVLASNKNMNYLKANKIPHRDNISDEVAGLLIDHYRIERKLREVGVL